MSALVFCLWAGLVHAQEDTPVDFEADSVTVNNQDGNMIATGNVTIIQNGDVLRADQVIYNPSTETARASGNVTLTTIDNIVHSATHMFSYRKAFF